MLESDNKSHRAHGLDKVVFKVKNDKDIINIRKTGKEMSQKLGFSLAEQTLIATAISEVARNILEYAGAGEVRLQMHNSAASVYLEIIAKDQGPGIMDVDKAMQDGFSTGKGMGLGLPGTKRIMDDFEIISHPGKGTKIIMRKWKYR